jgi:hypothetical protein
MFGNEWEPCTATIVLVHEIRAASGFIGFEYVADVQPPSGRTFRVTIQEPRIAIDFFPPLAGQTVSVLVKGDKVKFDKDDPQLSRKARNASSDAQFASVANSTANTRGPADQRTSEGREPFDIAALLSAGSGGASIEAIRAAALKAIASGNVMNLTGNTTHPPVDPATRLAQIEAIKRQGLMTDDEYAAARQHIIDAI